LSKDRDGIEDDERLAPEVHGDAAADEPTDLDSAAADDAAGEATDAEPESTADEVPVDADEIEDAEVAEADDAEVVVIDTDHITDEDTDSDADSDAAADGDGKSAKVGATAASGVAGSNRAAARAASSSRAAATTAKKDAPTRQRDTSERAGYFARIGRFIREVVAELRKVIWPSRKQWATFTLVVIVFLVIMVALVSGLDVLFHLVVGKVFG
jgi:preprotein translocase subunit SecE